MRTFISTLAVSALLFLAPAAVRAEDPAPTPAERAASVMKSMPAPSEKGGLKLDLEVTAGGSKIGSGRFEVTPDTTDGKPTWKAVENFLIEVGPPKKQHAETTTVLAADLHLLRLDKKEYQEGEAGSTTTAVRTEKGFDLVKKSAEGEKTSAIEADAQTLGSITSVILFLQNCPADPAPYDVHALSEEKGEIHSGTIEVKGAGKFVEGETTIDAWMAAGKIGEHGFEIYFDAADRSFLAMRMDTGILISKAGILKAAAPADIDTSKPAATAVECGARLALAILISDEELLAGAIHWPSMLADAKATKAFAGDEAEYKKLVMDNFRASFKTMKRADAAAIVKGCAAGAKETVTGDVTVVKFGAPMDKFSYSAKLIDGAWYIVKFAE